MNTAVCRVGSPKELPLPDKDEDYLSELIVQSSWLADSGKSPCSHSPEEFQEKAASGSSDCHCVDRKVEKSLAVWNERQEQRVPPSKPLKQDYCSETCSNPGMSLGPCLKDSEMEEFVDDLAVVMDEKLAVDAQVSWNTFENKSMPYIM